MRCPECNAPIDSASSFCSSCGLLLLEKEQAPKRRREDLASERRRSADGELVPCRFCHGQIDSTAIRCRHCSQVVNEEFHRQLLKRRRAQLNFASWVLYIFGLLMFIVFRPVGLVLVGFGLMLSVLYYAIPGEEITEKQGFWKTFRRQLKLERVSLPLPHLGKRKVVLVGSPVLAAVIGYFANFFLLQEPMNDILRRNQSLSGINVSAHYRHWVMPGVVVYDLRSVSESATPLQVQTALLEYARAMKERQFRRVELSFRGNEKFWLDGETFRRLGVEYDKKNFSFVLFAFPRLIRSDGPVAEVGDATTAEEALLALHRVWYADDILRDARKR